jgi:hypothetical protein
MNRQVRSDIRSLMMHKLIAEKLKTNPQLWLIPQKNIDKWLEAGVCEVTYREWKNIFFNSSQDEIIEIITSDTENSKRLRSSSPFTGILSIIERNKFFLKHEEEMLKGKG